MLPQPLRFLAEVPHPVVTIDPDGRAIDLNPPAQRLLGYCGREAAARPMTELVAGFPPLPGLRGSLAALPPGAGRAAGRAFHSTALRADGAPCRVEVTLVTVDLAPGYLTAWLRRLDDHESPEAPSAGVEMLNLPQARFVVSKALREWRGLSHLLEILAASLRCEAATLWVPEDHEVLAPKEICASPALRGCGFELQTRRLRMPRGVGLPGLVWQRSQPVDLSRLPGDRSQARQSIFDEAGMRAAAAFPLLGDDLIGVIDLQWRTEVAITDQQLVSLAGMGYELGAFLSRRQAELQEHGLTPRELEVLQLAADGLSVSEIAARLWLSPATVKTHLEHIYTKLGVTGRAAAVANGIRCGLID